MYKIGNQIISLKKVFSVGEIIYFDGCTILLYIHSAEGAKVEVKFKAKHADNCSISGPVPDSFINRTNEEIDQLINLITQIEYKP